MKYLPIFFSLTQAAIAGLGFDRKHQFPELGPAGEQVANEFQMVLPENIGHSSKFNTAEYSITKVSPLIIKNDDIVTIQYTTTKAAANDWIGAYSPADIDITTTVPVKYGWCDDSPSYLATGVGALEFNFTNLRADVAFYYFTGGTSKPTTVAKALETVSFANKNEPLRPRVVPTGDVDKLKLLWSSASSTSPVLRWGIESGIYTSTVAAVSSRIDKSDMCGAPANTKGWRDLGLIHTAIFQGMSELANKKVYYSFGDLNTSDFSQEFILNVPPLPGTQPPARPTTVVLYDDMGRGSTDMSYTWNEYGRPAINTTMAVAAEIAAGSVDAIYHGGDLSYATGYMAVWDFFLDMITPLASSVIYLTTVGNHESDWTKSASYYSVTDSGGECGVCAVELLPMPAPASVNEPWWSYDIGLMHFIGVSSEHNYTVGSKQYQWLEADLKAVDRSVTPWVIFGCHRAMYLNSDYSSNPTGDIEAMDLLIANLEPLLFKYKANLGFYGHNHVVQRQAAVLNKRVIQRSEIRKDTEGFDAHWQEDPQATVHLVIGTAGASFTKNFVEPKPDWNEDYFYQWGFSKVVAHNASYLSWVWIDSSTNEVVERIVLTQRDPFAPFISTPAETENVLG